MTGLRARPWQPNLHTHEEAGDTLAKLCPRQPEPGFAPTLRAFTECNPRIARVSAMLAVALLIWSSMQ